MPKHTGRMIITTSSHLLAKTEVHTLCQFSRSSCRDRLHAFLRARHGGWDVRCGARGVLLRTPLNLDHSVPW